MLDNWFDLQSNFQLVILFNLLADDSPHELTTHNSLPTHRLTTQTQTLFYLI